MRDKPVDLQKMFRRALLSQVSIGLEEVVLGDPVGDLPHPAQPIDGPRPELVTVKSALKAGLPDYPEFPLDQDGPSSMELSFESKFASIGEHLAAISDCQLCPLGQHRNKFVYGVGNPDADIMFIGEAPGAEEDRLGEPFVGRAGKLLDRILTAMELSRDQVYIGNILKCRPPANRDPRPDEMAKCMPYLREQIHLIKPKILCLLGRVAAHVILSTTTPLGRLRNRWHQFEGIPTIVTYHPAALLRFPAYKKDTWADMQELMRRYAQLG